MKLQLSEDVSYGLATVAGYSFVSTCPINAGNVQKLSRAAVHVHKPFGGQSGVKLNENAYLTRRAHTRAEQIDVQGLPHDLINHLGVDLARLAVHGLIFSAYVEIPEGK